MTIESQRPDHQDICVSDALAKKHPCPDCDFCQWCSDDRCRLCLNRTGCGRRKLSLTEQIERYNALNLPTSAGDGID